MKKIIVKKARNGQHYFIIRARNGRVELQSETYTERSSALRAARSWYWILNKLFTQTKWWDAVAKTDKSYADDWKAIWPRPKRMKVKLRRK